ncbi:PREDICTED: transcription elongation regulator 1-like protein [Tinamus guttatus]|uniref:transcription elongation regulator 1-like protein n=1 Tax=Tinamus guttatus TaxID=94827 RepID=UPI00052EC61D|nr:PREDICTED: transcription elongation regulator 1-like protein [Tinamus guttatus]
MPGGADGSSRGSASRERSEGRGVNGSASRMDAHVKPLMPAQVTRVTALSAPAVTFMATNLMDQTLAGNGKESSRASCPPALILHTDRKRKLLHNGDDKDHALKLLSEDDSAANGNKPVASTPVPGSPCLTVVAAGAALGLAVLCSSARFCCGFAARIMDHHQADAGVSFWSRSRKAEWGWRLCPLKQIRRCVVWTGDDRVFFFNPTMQLSVWEKPMDLKDRGDINRIIEDPPHKRKLETSATDRSISSCPGDESDDLSIKTKRNKTEDPRPAERDRGGAEEPRIAEAGGLRTPVPYGLLFCNSQSDEYRLVTRFIVWLTLRFNVSAFSTWEKELHKIVFDPRYLLLNSEERKQIFEQFVKARIREEYKEKKNKLLLAKEEFKKLLEESKLSPRTTFKEFAEKYGRDQRFRLVQKKKDQEHFFNQFILILKKRDKENRIRLRKMR